MALDSNKEEENCYYILNMMSCQNPDDIDNIDKIINIKQNEWNRNKQNPHFQAEANANLAMLDDIKACMHNDSERQKHWKAAQALKEEKKNLLRAQLTGLTSQESELTKKQLNQLKSSFAPYGFGEEQIKQIFEDVLKNGSFSEGSQEIKETITQEMAKNINDKLGALLMGDGTLYSFLGNDLGPDSSCDQLCKAAEDGGRWIRQKGQQDTQDAARQELYGICSTVFKDEHSKELYDNYLEIAKYPDVNEQIDIAAKLTNNDLTYDMLKLDFDLAIKSHHLSADAAYNYVVGYCAFKGYKLMNVTREQVVASHPMDSAAMKEAMQEAAREKAAQEANEKAAREKAEEEKNDQERQRLYSQFVNAYHASIDIDNAQADINKYAHVYNPIYMTPVKTIFKCVLWTIASVFILVSWSSVAFFAIITVIMAVRNFMYIWPWIQSVQRYLTAMSICKSARSIKEYTLSLHGKELGLLPEPYYLKPRYYQQAMQYLEDKEAYNLSQVLDRLRGNYY